MQTFRQVGTGLLLALASLLLVIGGLSLALSEPGNQMAVPTETGTSPFPTIPILWTETETSPIPILNASETDTPAFPSAEAQLDLNPVQTQYFPPYYGYVAPTWTPDNYYSCQPFRGWFRFYIVQPGDTLFGIAAVYRTGVFDLERANCLTSFAIYPGERLRVPNVPFIPSGSTIIPTFSTSTYVPTEPQSTTPLPITATLLPPSPPSTVTDTAVPVTSTPVPFTATVPTYPLTIPASPPTP